ncbi:MAG: hypothetical protein ACHQX3_00465 [Nitrospirales bacterium]
MTEDEFLKSVAADTGSSGKFVLSIARLFISLPLTPEDTGYQQQQSLLAEIQRCEKQHNYDIGKYPVDLKIMLLMILRSVNELNEDAMRYLVASLIFKQ